MYHECVFREHVFSPRPARRVVFPQHSPRFAEALHIEASLCCLPSLVFIRTFFLVQAFLRSRLARRVSHAAAIASVALYNFYVAIVTVDVKKQPLSLGQSQKNINIIYIVCVYTYICTHIRVYIHTPIFKMYTIFNTFYYYLIFLRLSCVLSSFLFQSTTISPFSILASFVFLTPVFLGPQRDAEGRGVSTLCISRIKTDLRLSPLLGKTMIFIYKHFLYIIFTDNVYIFTRPDCVLLLFSERVTFLFKLIHFLQINLSYISSLILHIKIIPLL